MKVGVIGGSGIYNFENVKKVEDLEVVTPYGNPSSNILKCEVDTCEFYFLPRHGIGHHIAPSDINYLANIFALKKLGVKQLISISAVGSLKENLKPTDFFIPTQFVDWTKGKRERSFFSGGMVGHVSVANPVELSLAERINKHLKQNQDISSHIGGSYICIEGPQFSSKAESNIYRGFGCDVIGMTNVPEAYLAKEAGMAYATVAMITDYDCWKEEHCTLEEIMNVMKSNYVNAQKLLLRLIPDLVKNPIVYTPENKNSVVTQSEKLSADHKKILEVLLK
jgi:5'-methylthioadenosine phosphorylase